jgi:hypothetical protein
MADRQQLKKTKKAKKHKKKKKHKERLLDHLRLLALAQLGDARKVEEFLNRHGSKPINVYDAEGCTPLHQVPAQVFSHTSSLFIVFLMSGQDWLKMACGFILH